MSPGSIDDILAAYHQALRTRRDTQDRLVIAAAVVTRLQTEITESTKIIRELRAELRAFGNEPSGEVAA